MREIHTSSGAVDGDPRATADEFPLSKEQAWKLATETRPDQGVEV